MRTATVLAFLYVIASVVEATPMMAQTPQTANTSLPRGHEPSIFAPLTSPPAPSATRLATGAPGPHYWQNRPDYTLHATLDTATNTLQGTMTLRYTNHSPDALPFLWFGNRKIDRITERLNGKPVAVSLGDQLGDQHPKAEGEMEGETKVALPQPIKPGETATFDVTWHFVVEQEKRRRQVYHLEHWYPCVNVYDDVKGWKPIAGPEMENFEYGNYTIAVTVPAEYIVVATGVLANPQDVLTPTERARLARAAQTDTVVPIITAEELRTGVAHLKHTGLVTWTFHAANVQDAVWSTSPQYQWDATSWKGIVAQAYYRPSVAVMFHGVAATARLAIQEYSERWYLYPYPQVSVVEALGEGTDGLSYPMLSFVKYIEDDGGSYPFHDRGYRIVTHEVGHNWFPLLVGASEWEYNWMSEGITTFISAFSTARRYPELGNQDVHIHHQISTGEKLLIGDSYDGTAYVLGLLRRDVLGPAVFDTAFRTFIRRWAYKHPTAQDFFRTMENVSGRNLAWFWRECFLEAVRFDQAIDSVRQTGQGPETHVTVTYGNKGRAVMPVLVRFTFSDSTTQDVVYPAEVWRANPAAYTVSYTFAKKTVRRIVLDPEEHLPDADRKNNSWTAP